MPAVSVAKSILYYNRQARDGATAAFRRKKSKLTDNSLLEGQAVAKTDRKRSRRRAR